MINGKAPSEPPSADLLDLLAIEAPPAPSLSSEQTPAPNSVDALALAILSDQSAGGVQVNPIFFSL